MLRIRIRTAVAALAALAAVAITPGVANADAPLDNMPLRNALNSTCLDLNWGVAPDDPWRVNSYPCWGGDNQQWSFDNGSTIRNRMTNECLAAVPGWRDDQNGRPLRTTSDCSDPWAQWDFTWVDQTRGYPDGTDSWLPTNREATKQAGGTLMVIDLHPGRQASNGAFYTYLWAYHGGNNQLWLLPDWLND